MLKDTFHLQLLQEIGYIPQVAQYITEPLLYTICTSHSPTPSLSLNLSPKYIMLCPYFSPHSSCSFHTCTQGPELFTYFLLLLPDPFVWIRCPVLKHLLCPQRSFPCGVSTMCLLLMLWVQKPKNIKNRKKEINNLVVWIVTSL